MGTGSTYQSTVNTWSAGNFKNVSGSVNFVSTNGATFYITGVQLEKGTTATTYQQSVVPGSAVGGGISDPNIIQYSWSSANTSSIAGFVGILPVTMRTSPTLSFWDLNGNVNKVATLNATGTATNNVSLNDSGASEAKVYFRSYANSAYGIAFAYTTSAEL